MTSQPDAVQTVMLCLAGGQPMPNLNAALFFHPQEVHILASKDTVAVAQNTVQALRREGIAAYTVQDTQAANFASPYLVDPYDVADTRHKALALAQRYPNAAFIFNLTGGTKIMSIGLYNAALAARINQDALSIVYVDPQNDRMIHLSPEGPWRSEPLKVAISVETYLLAHGWKIDESRCADSKQFPCTWHKAANILANAGLASHELLIKLRQAKGQSRQTAPPYRLRISTPLEQACLNLLHALQRVELLPLIELQSNGWEVSIEEQRVWEFLDGHWLELYIWDELLSTSQCDETRMGLCISRTGDVFQEMDVLATYNGRMLYVSCKTSRRNVTEYLNEMETMARITGGLYCTKVFVTNGPSPKNDARVREFKLHADYRRVVPLFNEDLPNIGQRLVQELQRPTYRST
ncbi:MAG: Card1-like endonuclease domain-containing protein [Anaerolineae bacterium]